MPHPKLSGGPREEGRCRSQCSALWQSAAPKKGLSSVFCACREPAWEGAAWPQLFFCKMGDDGSPQPAGQPLLPRVAALHKQRPALLSSPPPTDALYSSPPVASIWFGGRVVGAQALGVLPTYGRWTV